MAGVRSPLMINCLPVGPVPAEIDITTADQLRMVLLRSAPHGHTTVVVDMIRARLD